MNKVSDSLNAAQTGDDKLREGQARLWLAENEQAFREYNTAIEKFGVWSDKLRSW